MTPQQKAKELVDKYLPEVRGADRYNYNLEEMNLFIAKQCALICVENEYAARIKAYNELSEFCPDVAAQAVFYAKKELEEVKQAIQAL